SMIACSVATVLSGLIAGLIFIANRRKMPALVMGVAAAIIIEGIHMGLVLVFSRPFSQALTLVSDVAFPMIAANAAGIFVFGYISLNLKKERETAMERDRYQGELQRKNAELHIAREIQESFLPPSL